MVPGDSGEDHVLPSNHHRAVWRGPQLHQLNQIYTREQLCALLYAGDGKILLINHILFQFFVSVCHFFYLTHIYCKILNYFGDISIVK